MQLLKIVFTLIAVGGSGYALFRFSRNAPGWVKILSLILGFSTLVGVMIALPQAFDALEQTGRKVASYFTPSKPNPARLPRPTVNAVQPPKLDDRRATGNLSTSGNNSPIVSGVGGSVNIRIDGL